MALPIVLALACTHGAFAQSGDPVTLTSDTEIATAGYFQLLWEAAEPIRLVESTTADFDDPHTVYEGSDSGHTVSGRADGTLFYRLESAATGAVLVEPVRVVVAHHPIARAFTFFGVGALVFVATAMLILIGIRTADDGTERAARSTR
ncbi:MAG TPA: hypothetical protein VKQ06_02720 [Gammaproteobacteria bacterium]|nr:hypothetical protein [Gammaproteobacteria bacterium]